jgi:hypothetical protein
MANHDKTLGPDDGAARTVPAGASTPATKPEPPAASTPAAAPPNPAAASTPAAAPPGAGAAHATKTLPAAGQVAVREDKPADADVLASSVEESEPSRRRWRRLALARAGKHGRRWDRWYWVVARGVATAGIGALAILLGTVVLPKLVDTSSGSNRSESPPPATPAGAPQIPGGVAIPEELPSGLPTPSTTVLPSPTGPVQSQPGRPADQLAAWAVALDRLGIPQVALQAYGYAETVLTRTQPACNMSWTLLAGIGAIESNHGRHGGATLLADGNSQPKIVGIQLNGSASKKIPDSDGGQLDGDPQFDRAMGAMQFIPSTWKKWGTDADADGRADPYDLDDAALSAAYYLCANGRDLGTGEGWWQAVLSYNNLERYADDVYQRANRYGVDSTTR